MQSTGDGTPDIKLIATDLDGTLIGSANEFPLYATFREAMNALRRRNNAVWAACTGRTFKSFWEFFSPMRTMGVMPDYVVIRHAYIYGLTRFGYVPHVFWNLHIRYLLWANQIYVREAMNEWQELLTGGSAGVTTVFRRRNRLCMRFDSDEAAEVAAGMLQEKIKPFRHMRAFQYRREVDVREVPYTKGLAVAELASHLSIRPENVLAIGNGSNDISMLEGNVARYTGCPSNSEAEVIRVVHNSGGHIASGRSLAGVMEILDATMAGKPRSDLPNGWRPPEELPNPMTQRPSRPRRLASRRKAATWIVPAVAYSVLLAFASFDLVPFSGLITKPLDWLQVLVEKLMGFFQG